MVKSKTLQKEKQEEDNDIFDSGDDKPIAKEKKSETMKKEKQEDQGIIEDWVVQIKLFIYKLPKISEYMVHLQPYLNFVKPGTYFLKNIQMGKSSNLNTDISLN